MIPIYLCDDEPTVLDALGRELERAVIINEHDMHIARLCSSPEDLLETIKTEAQRGVYFLDIDLKSGSYNGFSLAAEIRKIDPRGFLIFITTHGELALETFHHHLEAMDYIVKDRPEKVADRLSSCLHEVEARLLAEHHEVRQFYTIQMVDHSIRHIPVDEILYIETSPKQHKLVLHADNAIVEYVGKLGEVESALGDSFWRIHRSYLVRRQRIRRILLKGSVVVLDNDETCPLSRKEKRRAKTI